MKLVQGLRGSARAILVCARVTEAERLDRLNRASTQSRTQIGPSHSEITREHGTIVQV